MGMHEEGLQAGGQGGMHADHMRKMLHSVMEGCEHASGCVCVHKWDEGVRSHILPISHRQAP